MSMIQGRDRVGGMGAGPGRAVVPSKPRVVADRGDQTRRSGLPGRMLEIRARRDELIVTLGGELGRARPEAVAGFGGCLARLFEAGWARMVVDLGEIDGLSGTLIGLLAGLHHRVRRRGGELTIIGLSPSAREALRICCLDRVLDLEPPADSDPACA